MYCFTDASSLFMSGVRPITVESSVVVHLPTVHLPRAAASLVQWLVALAFYSSLESLSRPFFSTERDEPRNSECSRVPKSIVILHHVCPRAPYH